MNQARKRTGTKKVLSMILVLVMLLSLLSMAAFTLPTAASSDSAASNDDFMRIFHLDCGRKYFTVDQIKDLIDAASASNYTHVELAIGNDALRFLLNDMSVTVNGTTYSSENVEAGIQAGNTNYTSGSTGELTQSEMDTIIAYAKGKNISIIPLLNSPGHMDAIIDCMESLGMSNVAFSAGWYGTSARTINLNNSQAVAFTQALVQKYVEYFAGKGCKYFNMGADEYANDIFADKYSGMGFGYLVDNGGYDKFVDYVNTIAKAVKAANMTPMAFNDGIYYSNVETSTFESYITVCYWTVGGWSGYAPASASFLAGKGHKIINTNDAWYYVLGRTSGSYALSGAKNGVANTRVTDVPGNDDPTPIGAMMCLWCDSPSASYNNNTNEQNNVKSLIQTLAANNKDYFTSVSPAEPEILTSTGSTTLDVDGGSTTLSISDGAEATWTVDPSDGSVIKLISASNADGDSITGSRVEAVATGKGTATITATVGTKTYTMKLTVADPNEVTVEVPAGSDWTTTVKDVDLRNQVGDYDESVAKVKVSYDKKDGGITVTPVTSVSSGTAYYIRSNDGKYLDKDAKWVADSASAAKWTWDGYYLSCDGSYLRYSSSNWTTSTNRNRATLLYFNNGEFYGSRSWDYWNGDYTYSNSLGSPVTIKTDPEVNASTITITGVTAGQETTVKIGDVTYRIKVTDEAPSNAMTETSIDLEYWITNYEVYKGTSTSTEHIKTISSSDAAGAEGIEIANIAPNHAYSFFDGTKDVYYWQAMRLDADNLQTNASGDDETSDGTTLTHIRYHSGAWQYKTTDGAWHYFLKDDQLVAYYLQKTEVTKEIDTYAKDWGYGTSSTTPDTSSGNGQVALTVAVVYPDGTVSPAEGDMYANSTTIFNYWSGRDIGIVAPTNNSDYNISKITVTDGKRDGNTDANVWYTNDSITWNTKTNVAGKEWYDETEVWNKSSGTTPMVNGKTSKITWAKNNTAKLVLIYLEPIEKETNLNVQYIDLNANNHVFHSYQVAMKYNQSDDKPTFTKSLMLGNTVIGDKGPWNSNVNGDVNYLPDEAYVTNSSNTKQTFKKDITTIPEINGIYASGLYKYMKADISEDGKTLRLYYDLNATEGKTFVVDFGLPVEIPFSDFGITNISDVTVSFDEQNTAMMERPGNYGNGKIDMTAKTVTYTLTKTLDAKIPIPVYVADKNGNVQMLSVNVIPATSVYYEDSFATFTNANGEKDHLVPESDNVANGTWMTVTDGITQTDVKQALEALGSKENVYGYDGAYANSSKFSMGSATKVTVAADTYKEGETQWPTATFTFKGTGFDVISLTDNNSGAISVKVYSVGSDGTETQVKGKLVNNYYGYTYKDGKWTATPTNTNNALYQIPVIKIDDLTYGTYKVVITVSYASYADKTDDGQYSFWLDAIRVYNPMGVNNETYKQDSEGYPQYIKLRDALADGSATAAGKTQMVFIDGGSTADIQEAYANYGPNNEVYLATGQAIAFNVSVPNGVDVASIQIGAKAPAGNAAEMSVNDNKTPISSATEMYYTITSADGHFTITNTGKGALSLTNLKITFRTEPSTAVELAALTTADQESAVAQVRALFAAPEQTFEPEYFTAKWSRNVRKGGTATLTVKASADVEAITVNGEKITTYTTKTARSVWGAKETYHVFTYRVPNAATADYSICAVNADGVVSDPITATLTVRPSIRDWWNGIFDKWKH